jgi:hypothetical protein
MHAACHQHGGPAADPATAAQRQQWQRVPVIWLDRPHVAIGFDVPLVSHQVYGSPHIGCMASLAHLALAPLSHFGRTLRLAWFTNGMVKGMGGRNGRHGMLCDGQTRMMPPV